MRVLKLIDNLSGVVNIKLIRKNKWGLFDKYRINGKNIFFIIVIFISLLLLISRIDVVVVSIVKNNIIVIIVVWCFKSVDFIRVFRLL